MAVLLFAIFVVSALARSGKGGWVRHVPRWVPQDGLLMAGKSRSDEI